MHRVAARQGSATACWSAAVPCARCVDAHRAHRQSAFLLGSQPERQRTSGSVTSSLIARAAPTAESVETEKSSLPQPSIKIDNQSDSFSTIVKVDFGGRLGELLDTIQSLKNMGYNISRAKLSEDSKNKFYVTDARTAEKVTASSEIESIRQCIIHNMMDYHPESASLYATGAEDLPGRDKILGLGSPPGTASSSVTTSIKLKTDETHPYTHMNVDTRDRPGLLVDIVRTLKDCSVNVLSAEVDTLGERAQDEFILSYHGAALNKNMRTLIKNSLQYYLAMADVSADESY